MKEKELERLLLLKKEEQGLYSDKIQYICGIDEAGRGPLAGPVVVAAVIMPKDSMLEYVNDSKKVTPKRRELLYDQITSTAIAWGVGIIDHETIDKINILEATKLGVTKAIDSLKIKPDVILVDALTHINTHGIPYKSIIKGDSKEYSIACSSIIAKVTRDRIMQKFDKIYPEYGFEKHKGYGTSQHIKAIKEFGPCDIHRRTFIKNFTNEK